MVGVVAGVGAGVAGLAVAVAAGTVACTAVGIAVACGAGVAVGAVAGAVQALINSIMKKSSGMIPCGCFMIFIASIGGKDDRAIDGCGEDAIYSEIDDEEEQGGVVLPFIGDGPGRP